MESLQDKYIREHSSSPSEALLWVEKMTNIKTNYPRMLSGAVQGRLLSILAQMLKAHDILEIGCFTGYSTICLAEGLTEDGHIDSLEINDELEDIIREGWQRSGLEHKMSLHLGDALDILKQFVAEGRRYDLVYIDANKREYPDYYRAVKPLLRDGGVILADDTMLGGKVYNEPETSDKQTKGLLEFNKILAEDPEMEVVILPLRDGLSIAIYHKNAGTK